MLIDRRNLKEVLEILTQVMITGCDHLTMQRLRIFADESLAERGQQEETANYPPRFIFGPWDSHESSCLVWCLRALWYSPRD